MNKCEKHNTELNSLFGSEPLCERCFFENNKNLKEGFMDKIIEIGKTTDNQPYIKIASEGKTFVKDLYKYLEEDKDVLGSWKNKTFVNILEHILKEGMVNVPQKIQSN